MLSTLADRAPLRTGDVLLIMVLTAAVLLSASFLTRDLAATPEAVVSLLLLQSAIPLVIVYLVLVRARGMRWRDIGMRPAPHRWYLWAALTALATVGLVGVMNTAIQWLTEVPFDNPQIEMLAPGGFSWRGLVGMLLAAGIVAPVTEEVIFRGLLFGWLRQHLGPVASMAISAIVFSLAHGIALLIPALALQGVVLAFFYERSGSLWPSVVLHGAFNGIMVIALYVALAAGAVPAR